MENIYLRIASAASLGALVNLGVIRAEEALINKGIISEPLLSVPGKVEGGTDAATGSVALLLTFILAMYFSKSKKPK